MRSTNQFVNNSYNQNIKNSFVFDSIIYSIKEKLILNGVYLQFKKNKICGLFGRNGSGKSTLLKIGAGQIRPLQGIVFIEEEPFYSLSLRKRFFHIAYLPQETFLPSDLKVKNLFRIFPAASQFLLDDEIINKWLDFRVSSLSSGQRRYLEVNLILSLERSYVLLDEPFTGIEPYLNENLVKKIIKYASLNRGILIADHYYHYLFPIVHDAYIINQGFCEKLIDKNELIRIGYLHKGYKSNKVR